jgi:alginate O-acetyltransferase complex protein AlgI
MVFWKLKTKMSRYIWLTCCSYIFYGYWNYKFCFWMALSTLISFTAGLGLRKWDSGWQRRACLIVPVSADLAILCVFKYAQFILSNIQSLLHAFGSPSRVPVFQIVLPIGISFYTFHTISYIVDCYRKQVRPATNIWEFACYVSLFSQLVAGPIVRFRQVEKDLEHLDADRLQRATDLGWSFFTIGMIKKVLIADSIAAIINPALANYTHLSGLGAWMCVFGYGYQLYFDFSGYSDMAIGLGHLFGIQLPQNFDSPYQAVSPADFWKRWHMTLSACLRDYLFYPIYLGMKRETDHHLKLAVALVSTMFLGGLWHGANWTFVAWGMYHGVLLVLHRGIQARWDRWPSFIQKSLTFLLVSIGWVFFRSNDWHMVNKMLHSMFTAASGSLPVGTPLLICALIGAGSLAHFGPNTFELKHEWNPAQLSAFAMLFTMCIFAMYIDRVMPFLYFQF